MKDRRFKVHYAIHGFDIGVCGLGGSITYRPNDMTCHICMFRYLASQAPWAQSFLDELRGKVGRGQPAAVIVPTATAEPVDGKVEGTSHGQAGPFGQQRVTQKAISELLPVPPAFGCTVKPVMQHGWPPAESVRVKEWEVAQRARDAGQVSYKPSRYDKAD